MVGFNTLYMPLHNKIDSRIKLRTSIKKVSPLFLSRNLYTAFFLRFHIVDLNMYHTYMCKTLFRENGEKQERPEKLQGF